MSTKRFLLGTVIAGLLLATLSAGAAVAQSPSYQTKPRSGGGKAAQFGGAPKGGTRSAQRGMNGAPPTAAGAARPQMGSLAPNSPIKGGTTGGGRKSYGNAGGVGGQIFSADQLKAGAANNGIFKPGRSR